jgi:hypothetical protein
MWHRSPVLLLLLLSPPLGAQDSAPRLEGSFAVRDQAAAQRSVDAGIERVVQAFNPLLRPLVRPYMAHVTRYCPEPGFAWQGDAVSYRCRDQTLLSHPADGQPFQWTPATSDETTTVRIQQPTADSLVLDFSNELGGRTQTFSLQPDGTLRCELVYYSDKLPVPLTYGVDVVRSAP